MTKEEAINHLMNDWYKVRGKQICVDSDKADSFLDAIGIGIKAINTNYDREAWTADTICHTKDGSRFGSSVSVIGIEGRR